MKLLEEAIAVYEKLIALTDGTHLATTDCRLPRVQGRTVGLKGL
ncbi:MAG: hypothetical protein ACYTES_17370 [Planctomycetota bacterium]